VGLGHPVEDDIRALAPQVAGEASHDPGKPADVAQPSGVAHQGRDAEPRHLALERPLLQEDDHRLEAPPIHVPQKRPQHVLRAPQARCERDGDEKLDRAQRNADDQGPAGRDEQRPKPPMASPTGR
jgi:hypothetical protein